MIRCARDTAAKERKRISAPLTWLHMDNEGNKINSEQEENTSLSARPWNSLSRNSVKCHCTVSSDNSDYKWDKAVSFCLLRAVFLKHLAFPRSNKQTNYYYHNTLNSEIIQFSIKLKERHVTILFLVRWS
jgi:hypothetical protein